VGIAEIESMKYILGKKINMTQVWRGEKVAAVTRVQAGPCPVIQIKTKDKDGYEAVQIGYGDRRAKNIKKPQRGQMKDLGNFRYQKEFRTSPGELKRGDIVNAGTFAPGDIVKVTGISKGKGFQGVVKRYHFHGASKTHGTKDQVRMPGSSGATGPQHVFKGTRKPGHMGSARVTVHNLEVVGVEADNNLLLIAGAVPGVRNTLLLIQGEGELTIAPAQDKTQVAAEKTDTVSDNPNDKSVAVNDAAADRAEAKK
jgi:large subunit ribosomal protein L3